MKSNFNSVALLCNVEIQIIGKRNESYVMKLPVLKDKLENLDFDTFASFCGTSVEEINSYMGGNFKDKYSLFKFYKKNKADIMTVLDKYFTKYMIGFKYVDDSLYWGKRLVSKEVFETFCNYCAIAIGVKSIKELDLIITEDMDEFEKRRILVEQKIAKTKAKNSNGGNNAELDQILVGVCKEFRLSYEQLKDMTLYCIYYMYSQLGKIANYEIGNIAAGNGLLGKNTKHNHWAY